MILKKKAFALLSTAVFVGLSACSSGGSSSGSGGDDASSEPFCSGEQMAGQWRVVGDASGFELSDSITLTEENATQTQEFKITQDGRTYDGTINQECNVVTGTFTAEGLTGNFTMVKQ